jgi:hypothetical protein
VHNTSATNHTAVIECCNLESVKHTSADSVAQRTSQLIQACSLDGNATTICQLDGKCACNVMANLQRQWIHAGSDNSAPMRWPSNHVHAGVAGAFNKQHRAQQGQTINTHSAAIRDAAFTCNCLPANRSQRLHTRHTQRMTESPQTSQADSHVSACSHQAAPPSPSIMLCR